MITHHCRECGEHVTGIEVCDAHPNATIDSIASDPAGPRDLCGCDESSWYEAVLLEVETWLEQTHAATGDAGAVDLLAKIRGALSTRRASDAGADECTECGGRFNATRADKRPVCPECK